VYISSTLKTFDVSKADDPGEKQTMVVLYLKEKRSEERISVDLSVEITWFD